MDNQNLYVIGLAEFLICGNYKAALAKDTAKA
jgi:hypothetical protein